MNTTQNNLYKIKTKEQICLNKKLKVGKSAADRVSSGIFFSLYTGSWRIEGA